MWAQENQLVTCAQVQVVPIFFSWKWFLKPLIVMILLVILANQFKFSNGAQGEVDEKNSFYPPTYCSVSYFISLNNLSLMHYGFQQDVMPWLQIVMLLWCIWIYLVNFLISPFCLLILSSKISPFVTSSLLPFCSGLEYFPFHILDHVLLSPSPLSQTIFWNLSFYVDLTIVPPLWFIPLFQGYSRPFPL